MSEDEELLTVAEAARALKIDPKQVRRYADKLTGQDRTPIGHIPLCVRLSAVIALRSGSESKKPESKSEATNAKDIGQDAGQDTHRTGQDISPSVSLVSALVYQQRITDLEAMNSELRADKERLYSLLETAQQNLAREQALRSLPPPETAEMEETKIEKAKMEEAKADTFSETGFHAENGEKPVGWWAKLNVLFRKH